MDSVTHKRCTTCKTIKSVSDFGRNKEAKDGLKSLCNDCQKKSRRRSYERNMAREKERSAKWGIENADKKRDQKHRWYEKNKDHVNSKARRWLLNNYDKFKINSHQRRVKERTSGKISVKQWRKILEMCGAKCMACGETHKIQMDHIVPVSKGGANTVDNIQVLCQSCNCRKMIQVIDYRPEQIILWAEEQSGKVVFK